MRTNNWLRCEMLSLLKLLMIGDLNWVLIVVRDEVKKNEWRCGSEARWRLVASKVEKATSRGFLTEVTFLGQNFAMSRDILETTRRLLQRVIAHWRRLVTFDGYVCCLFSRGFFDGYLSFLKPNYLLVRI